MPTTTDITSTVLEERIADLVEIRAQSCAMTPKQIAVLTLRLHDAMGGNTAVTRVADAAPVVEPAPVAEVKESEPQKLIPAVPVDQSVHADGIICLENGKKFTMLKRHLREAYNMTPEQYRLKWGLPDDYPMTAPNYSAKKSTEAKKAKLGHYERA